MHAIDLDVIPAIEYTSVGYCRDHETTPKTHSLGSVAAKVFGLRPETVFRTETRHAKAHCHHQEPHKFVMANSTVNQPKIWTVSSLVRKWK